MRHIKYILIYDTIPQNPAPESRHCDVLNSGYHYIINSKGLVFNAIDISKSGAFLDNYNVCSIGIQYNGALSNPILRAVLIDLIVDLRSHFPDAKILGVSEIDGKDLRPCAKMNRLRRELSDYL
ncbi:MAG: hypothetical protein K5920_03060 [Bacteroidales bacterium]|nr:hypothetical protein [Bacteroidales bacterium]